MLRQQQQPAAAFRYLPCCRPLFTLRLALLTATAAEEAAKRGYGATTTKLGTGGDRPEAAGHRGGPEQARETGSVDCVQPGQRKPRFRAPNSRAAPSPLLSRRYTSSSRCTLRQTTQTLETSSRRADGAGTSSSACAADPAAAAASTNPALNCSPALVFPQGFNEFLTSKSAQAKNKNRQFRLEDRVFSLSSITSPGVGPDCLVCLAADLAPYLLFLIMLGTAMLITLACWRAGNQDDATKPLHRLAAPAQAAQPSVRHPPILVPRRRLRRRATPQTKLRQRGSISVRPRCQCRPHAAFRRRRRRSGGTETNWASHAPVLTLPRCLPPLLCCCLLFSCRSAIICSAARICLSIHLLLKQYSLPILTCSFPY